MIFRITTTRLADDDIRCIATYIAIDSPKSARHFGDELWAAFGRIAEHPEAGQMISGFGVTIRRVRVSRRFHRYLVFYRQPDDSTLEIIRVLHGARDITRIIEGLT